MSYSNYYPVFENNQVLTSAQLNDLATYLDEQNRATRTKLIGIGIVCGLKPWVNVTFTNNVAASVSLSHLNESTVKTIDPATISTISDLTISLTEGKGVTSEGYLISLGDMEFTQYRAYTLPQSVHYDPFLRNNGSQVELWELLPDSYVPLPSESVFPLSDAPKDFIFTAAGNKRKVMMLFLECTDVDLKSCLGKSCDDLGIKRTFTLRKLLVDIADLNIIKSNTYNIDSNFAGKFDLPDLRAKRVLFDKSEQASRDYYAFSEKYVNALKELYPGTFHSRNIVEVLNDTYFIFQPILGSVYGNANPFSEAALSSIEASWTNIINKSSITGPSYLGIQYFYDFIKELLLAYDEFRVAAFDLMSDCCPPTGLFPKHLLLGEAIHDDSLRQSANRNDFIAAPITIEERLIRDRLISLHQRMVMMIRTFQTNLIHNPSTNALAPIRITPSIEKQGPLSLRAIPYYYDNNTNDGSLKIDLEAVWNFENLRRANQIGGESPVLAYNNQISDQSIPVDPITTPLWFDTDALNFYRIEGHLRQPLSLVQKTIEDTRNRFNLPFQVVTVRLTGAATSSDMKKLCSFPDLSAQYVAYRNTQDANLKRVLDRAQSLLNELNGTTSNDFVYYLLNQASGTGKSTSVIFQPRGLTKGGSVVTSVSPNPSSVSYAQTNLSARIVPIGHGISTTYVSAPYTVIPISQMSSVDMELPLQAPSPLSTIKNTMTNELHTMITALSHTLEKLPENIADFDFGTVTTSTNLSFIQQYLIAQNAATQTKAWFNRFLDEVTHRLGHRFPAEFYFQLSMWANDHMRALSQFVMDSSFKLLEAVSYEYKYRINYLIAHDPRLFSNFVQKNPGLEHKAGVQPGGTFVLVTNGQSLSSALTPRSTITTKAVEAQTIQNLKVRRAQIESSSVRDSRDSQELLSINETLSKAYESIATEILDHNAVRPTDFGAELITTSLLSRVDLPGDAVIADFSLPYSSVCDCNCTDIPTPTQADLGLPSIALTAYAEYNPGDYAFATDVLTSARVSPVSGVVIRMNQYLTFNTQGNVRLYFVSNGLSSSNSSFRTANGGTVTRFRSPLMTEDDYFTYSPSAGYTGVDSFEYYFEVVDDRGLLLARSNKSKVFVAVGRAGDVIQPEIPGEIIDRTDSIA